MKTILELFLKYKFGLIVFFLATLAVCNLFQPGLPPNHDGQNQVVRSYEFDKSLREGNWYPIWAQDLNYTYGVPLFNYVYPLPNYMSSFFHLFGASFIDTFKLNLILASYVGSLCAYLYGKQRFGKWGGLLASAFYTFAPYHLLDIYVRGSVGETWALALFPLNLLLLDKIVKKRSINSVILSGIVFALIIFSHNILAVMFAAFSATYALLLIILIREKKAIIPLMLQFIVGLLISSIFFLPALFEEQYVVGLKIFNVQENFPELYQLLIPSWGSGYSGQSSATQMSFQIGLANLLIVFMVLIKLFKKKTKKLLITFFISWFFLLCFFILPVSKPIWEKITLIQYFQFPWRLLSLVILCCSILAGSITILYKRKSLYILLIVFVVISTFSYAKAPYFYLRTDSYYMKAENFFYGTNSIGDAFQTKWFNQQKKLPESDAKLLFLDKNIFSLNKNTTKQEYMLSLIHPDTLIINTTYFPGWKAYIGSKEAPVFNNQGLIGVKVPQGKNTIILRFTDTPIRFTSKVISLVSLFIVLSVLFSALVLQYFYAHRH